MRTTISCILCVSNFLFCIAATTLQGSEQKDGTESREVGQTTEEPDKLPTGEDETPDVVGEVTLPYADMKSLWEKLKDKSEEPEKEVAPIDATVMAAEYDLEISENQSRLGRTTGYSCSVMNGKSFL